jgi:hypothetical protein
VIITEKLRKRKQMLSYLSQVGHLIKFGLASPKMRLEEGMLVMSVDVDVGNKELGIVNKGKSDRNVNKNLSEYSIGVIEEMALPMFLSLLERFEIPVTFAIRGQWLEIPNYTLDCLLESSVKHDIGGHGYYHRKFEYLSRVEADSELAMIHAMMNRSNLTPTSFVFPGNSIAHLDLLSKYGFKCYREHGGLLKDGMYIRRYSQLWDVHPSLYVDQCSDFLVFKKILDLCSRRKLPFHIWFHLWNFGKTENSIQKCLKNLFFPLLRYAKHQAKDGRLTFETMVSAVRKIETEN